MIAQIQQAGILVVAIRFATMPPGKNKMNPTMADEEQAYNAGLMEGSALSARWSSASPRPRR